jgi:predicted nucleic acid-binding protein
MLLWTSPSPLHVCVAPLEIVPFDDRAACRYGEIGALLEGKGKVIGPWIS